MFIVPAEMSADINAGRLDNIVLTRQLPSKTITQAIRSHLDAPKVMVDKEFGLRSIGAETENDIELDVRVHVEQSVHVDYERHFRYSPSGESYAGETRDDGPRAFWNDGGHA